MTKAHVKVAHDEFCAECGWAVCKGEIEFNAETAREWLAGKLGVGRYAFTIEHVDTDLWAWSTKTESGVVYPLNDRSGWAFEYDV